MAPKSMMAVAVALILMIVASDSYFVVNETERVVVKRFGRIIDTDVQPGFYFKVPFFDKVVRVDGRTLVYDVPTQSIPTSEKKLLNVDFFVVWRVKDVQLYITNLGGGQPAVAFREAQDRLMTLVDRGLRDEFSQRTVEEVIAGEREEVMNRVAAQVNEKTERDFGVEVIDIRVKRVDWPDDVRDRVFARMRAERARDAAEHRAEGQEQAEKIRAEADRQRTVLLAEAYRDAQALRGEGDARAASIYASAYGRDQEFFRFYRSLEAYRESLGSGNDILVIEPDSDFFRYLNQSGSR